MKVCTRCLREHDGPKRRCVDCLAKQRVYETARRSGHPTTGHCVHCGGRLPQKRKKVCLVEPCLEAERVAKHERRKARNRQRYAEDETHRLRVLRHASLWREENRELLRALDRSHYTTSPQRRESVKAAAERRRALMRGSRVVFFTPEQLEARLSMYPRCWICKTAGPTHVDHVKPLSKGGAHMLANLRPACSSCNLAKGSKWPFPT